MNVRAVRFWFYALCATSERQKCCGCIKIPRRSVIQDPAVTRANVIPFYRLYTFFNFLFTYLSRPVIRFVPRCAYPRNFDPQFFARTTRCAFFTISNLSFPLSFSLLSSFVLFRRLVDDNNISSICLSLDVSSLFLSLFFQSSSFTHTALLSPFSSRPTRVFVSTHETPDAF